MPVSAMGIMAANRVLPVCIVDCVKIVIFREWYQFYIKEGGEYGHPEMTTDKVKRKEFEKLTAKGS